MIEIKLSQGAKPGHGGLLPAEKKTKKTPKAQFYTSDFFSCF
jgi:glutamate synthase domain-containing protein 2